MQFLLRDGLLYFTEDGADSTAKQWIVDKKSQMKVITSCHDRKLGESRCYSRLIFTGFTCSKKAVGILDVTRLFRKSVRAFIGAI